MEGYESSATTLAPEQEKKVARIFSKFDEDKDGILRKVKSQPSNPLSHKLSCTAEACVQSVGPHCEKQLFHYVQSFLFFASVAGRDKSEGMEGAYFVGIGPDGHSNPGHCAFMAMYISRWQHPA